MLSLGFDPGGDNSTLLLDPSGKGTGNEAPLVVGLCFQYLFYLDSPQGFEIPNDDAMEMVTHILWTIVVLGHLD